MKWSILILIILFFSSCSHLLIQYQFSNSPGVYTWPPSRLSIPHSSYDGSPWSYEYYGTGDSVHSNSGWNKKKRVSKSRCR